MNRIDGKIAIVTGGTQGLGAAIARQLAEAGAAGVVICGRSAAKGEAVAADVTKIGVKSAAKTKVKFVTADLGQVEDCRAVVAATDEIFGRVDILVNAAGITDRGDILGTSPELFDRMFAVNTRGPFFLMQEAIRRMIRDERRRRDRQHRLGLGTGRAALHLRLLRFQVRAGDADAQHGLRGDAQPHPGEPAEHRLDGVGRRGHAFSASIMAPRPTGWMHAAKERPLGRLLAPEEVARAVNFFVSAMPE